MVYEIRNAVGNATTAITNVEDTTNSALGTTTQIQGNIEACNQAMQDTASTSEALVKLAQDLTEATAKFQV